MSKLSHIARAVAMFNALHNEKLTEIKARSFLSCLDMVKSQEQHSEYPQLVAAEGEALLNAVGRTVATNQPTDLIYDGKTIHIDPAMTLADAFAHAEYVLKLNERHPAGAPVEMPIAIPDDEPVASDSRPVVPEALLNEPASPTPELRKLMNRVMTEPEVITGPELTEQQQDVVEQVSKFHAPQLGRGLRGYQEQALKEVMAFNEDESRPVRTKHLPGYVRLTSGPVHQQQRDETLENVIERLMPLAPLRVRISGLVMTLQDGYTTAEMIEEAHRRVMNRINDEDTSGVKRLELEEEELSDGTLRTARRCWRRGYRYRLSVTPNNPTEFPEYHIHMKDRPTQAYMDPHLQLMYDKKARLFLNITNGFDRFENITHFFCTAAGRRATSELAQIEKQIHEEFVAKGGSYYEVENASGGTLRVTKSPAVQAIEQRNNNAKGPFYSESWEDNDCGYRVKYWDSSEKKWRYTYFPTQPNGMATQIRHVKGYPASIEFKRDFTTAPK